MAHEVNNTVNRSLDINVPSYGTGVFWCSFFSLQSLLITILNTFTIAIFVINPHLRKRSSYCIVNLAAADLLVGAVATPSIVHFLGVMFSFWGSSEKDYFLTVVHFQGTIFIFTGIASLFSLVLVSLERVLATVCPLQHLTTSGFYLRHWICYSMDLVRCSRCSVDMQFNILWQWSFSLSLDALAVIFSFRYLRRLCWSLHRCKTTQLEAAERDKEMLLPEGKRTCNYFVHRSNTLSALLGPVCSNSSA